MLLAGSSIVRFVLLPASARLGGCSTLTRVDAGLWQEPTMGYLFSLSRREPSQLSSCGAAFVLDCLDGLPPRNMADVVGVHQCSEVK
jgi:hypothetical protein